MAEEQTTPESGEDELVLTTDDQLPAEEDKGKEPVTVEALAQDMGWQPKEQFRGDPGKWKPADEFIRHGHEIQRNLTSDLRHLRTTVSTVQATTAEMFKQKLEDERQRLQAQYQDAFDQGDINATMRLGRDLSEVERKIETPVTTAPVAQPEVEQFVADNSTWFNKHPLATERAVRITNALAKEGYSTAYQLAEAKRQVSLEFPELFEGQSSARPAPSTHSASRASGPAPSRETFASMPQEAQRVALQMQEDYGIDKDLYAKNYFINLKRSKANG